MDYMKASNMDYLAKPTSLDYLSAYATMLDRTRLYFQGLPQVRDHLAHTPLMGASNGRERGEIPLDLSMKTIRQTPDSTAVDDDVIVLEHKKAAAAAARAHALSKLQAEAARHGARFSEAFLPPTGATFPKKAPGTPCQHNGNMGLLALYGGETLVPPPPPHHHLTAGHLGLMTCNADGVATGCVDFPRCRELMAPTSLALHPMHRGPTMSSLGGIHSLTAFEQRNAMAKLIPLCQNNNNPAQMTQDLAGITELHRLGLAATANAAGFLVPPSCVTMPLTATKMVNDRFTLATTGYPKENACPCCPPTGLPIPCACCLPKQNNQRLNTFTAFTAETCCANKDLPYVQQAMFSNNNNVNVINNNNNSNINNSNIHHSSCGSSKDVKEYQKNNRDSRKREHRHSGNAKLTAKDPTMPTLTHSEMTTPPSPDGCARTDGRDKHSIQREADRCRLSLMESPATTTRIYAPVANIPTASVIERTTTDTKDPAEATTPKDAPLPSGLPSIEELVPCNDGSPSPAKAEDSSSTSALRRKGTSVATVWRPGGNWDDDETTSQVKEAAIPTTVKDKAAPAQLHVETSTSFVDELVDKYRRRYTEKRALQRLVLSIKRPKAPTCSGQMLSYLVRGRKRTNENESSEGKKQLKIDNLQKVNPTLIPDHHNPIGHGTGKYSTSKRLENIRKRRHERIQKIIIKVRGDEKKNKNKQNDAEELDKVEKLIVRLYYGRRRLTGHHRRRKTIHKQQPEKNKIETNINPNNNNNKVKCPVEMKRLMINKTLGETLLHRAARQGYTEVVSYCLQTNSVSVDSKDNAGYTPLHECCSRGHLAIARNLLQHGADVNASAAGGIRPIHDAVENDHVEIVRLLLSYGADPLLATYSGLTPVKIAHSKRMTELLIGFLSDVSGDLTADVAPWSFLGAASFFDPVDNGFDLFDFSSSLEIDDDDGDNDIAFELSDRPHVDTFILSPPNSPCGPEVFCLLDQVLHQTGQSEADLLLCHSSARVVSLSWLEFSRLVDRSQLSLPLSSLGDSSSPSSSSVRLIRLDRTIRRLLGVETVFISAVD